jgi:hypothetical protein
MTFGVKVWSKNGDLWLDSTTITWNMVETFEVAAGADVTHDYADYAGMEFLVIQIPLEVPKVNDYTYEKTIVVGTSSVRVYGGNQIALIVVMAR